MKRGGTIKNQAGQIIIENVLLIVVLMGVFFSIVDFLKRQQFATKFTEAPWAMLDGMIQCGVWSPCSVKKPVEKKHPNAGERILSLDPKMEPE